MLGHTSMKTTIGYLHTPEGKINEITRKIGDIAGGENPWFQGFLTWEAVYARLVGADMNETDTLEAETEDDRARVEEREENARKAREEADRLFPGHRWRKVEDGIYLSPRRPIGKKAITKWNWKMPGYFGTREALFTWHRSKPTWKEKNSTTPLSTGWYSSSKT